MTIESTKTIKAEDNLVMIVYGKGGVGKTTFAASAPNPLILDFENGTKYLGERGINADVIRFQEWLTAKEKLELDKIIKRYETIVIDPLGEAMDKLMESKEISDQKYRTRDGSLTMAGWGEVKKQMRNFIKWLRDTGKNVIIVSHVSEISTDNGLEHRIQVATKLSDEIPNIVDVISYMGVQKRGNTIARILFTPAQGGNFDSKDRTGRVPLSVDISETSGWQDFTSAMRPVVRQELPQEPTVNPQQQVEAVSDGTEASTPITREASMAQRKQLLELAEKMADEKAANYLRMISASPVSFDVAQNIINRAIAAAGGK